jgi:hypothetical protein
MAEAAHAAVDTAAITEALRELIPASRVPGGPPDIDPTKLTTDAVNAMASQLRREAAAARELVEIRLGGMDIATRLVADQVNALPAEIRAQADRDLNAVRAEVHALRELMTSRLDGMDKASELLAENVRQFPSDLDKATRALREVLEGMVRSVQDVSLEKFTAIEGTFASNALALTAALAAQKEAAAEAKKSSDLAIDRANSTTKETIASNAAQFSNSLASQAATIADLKDRVVRIESGGLATREAGAQQQQADTFTQADRIAATAAAAGREAAARAAIISVVAVLVAIAAILFAAIHG